MSEDLTIFIRFIDRFTPIANKLDKTAKKINNDLRMNLQDARSAVSNFNRKAIVAFATVTGSSGLAINQFRKFEDALVGITKVLQMSDEEAAALGNQFEELSKKIPMYAPELMDIGAVGARLGIPKKNIVDFTRTIAELNVATDILGEEGATNFARFTRVMGMSYNDFHKLGSTITALGNATATTESAILDMATRLAPMGRLVNMTSSEILGLSASLSEMGPRAEMGSTALSQIFSRITQDLGKRTVPMKLFTALAGFGTDIKGFAEAWTAKPLDTLIKVIGTLNKLKDAGVNVVEIMNLLGIDGYRTSLVLSSLAQNVGNVKQNVEIAQDAWIKDIALTKEAERRYKTLTSKLTLFWNKVKIVGKEIGAILAPTLLKLVNVGGRVLLWLEAFIEKHPKLIKWIMLTTVAISGLVLVGGLLTAMLLSLLFALPGIIPLLSLFGAFFAPKIVFRTWQIFLSTLFGLFKMRGIIGVFSGIGEAISLLFSGLWSSIIKNGWAARLFRWSVSGMVKVLTSLWRVITISVIPAIIRLGSVLFGLVVANPIILLITIVLLALAAAIYLIYDNWEMLVEAIQTKLFALKAWFNNLKHYIITAFNQVLEGISSAISYVWEPIKKFFSYIWNIITEHVVPAVKKLSTVFLELNPIITALATSAHVVYKNWKSIKEFFTDLWNGAKNKFEMFIDAVKAKLFVLESWFDNMKNKLLNMLPSWMVDTLTHPSPIIVEGSLGGMSLMPAHNNNNLKIEVEASKGSKVKNMELFSAHGGATTGMTIVGGF